MKVTVTGLGVTPNAFHVGLRLEYAEGGPIRFDRVVIPDDALSWQDTTALAAWLDRMTRRHLERERELLNENQPVLFD